MRTSTTGKSRSYKKLKSLLEPDVFEMDPSKREAHYQKLREAMEEHYAKRVNPRRVRRRIKHIERLREAGTTQVRGRTVKDDHHTRHADQAEKELENDRSVYFGGGEVGAQTYKYALAILTGRYDNRMPTIHEEPMSVKSAYTEKAARQRLEELGRPYEVVRTWADEEAEEVKSEVVRTVDPSRQ